MERLVIRHVDEVQRTAHVAMIGRRRNCRGFLQAAKRRAAYPTGPADAGSYCKAGRGTSAGSFHAGTIEGIIHGATMPRPQA